MLIGSQTNGAASPIAVSYAIALPCSMTRGSARHDSRPSMRIQNRKKHLLRLVRLARRWQLHHPSASTVAAVSAFLVVLLILMLAHSRANRAQLTLSPASFPATLRLPESESQSFQLESALAAKLCSRKSISTHLEELRPCNKFVAESAAKVVGLVELRNVRAVLSSFLSALAKYTHSIVVLDDHSTDGTRLQLLQSPYVELILNRTGPWRRDELTDRQLLLEAGRRVGGTHFVLLDYDEFLSFNCLPWMRDEIVKLKPGQSMFIPWVEAWKSPLVQRVLKQNREMNFLTRRQTVIFADNRSVSYTEENALARKLSDNATLHVLRCPRTICPPLGRYNDADDHAPLPKSVKFVPECRILELRFLNVNNVLLKSAWYEALGRVLGAKDGATSGKMISRMFRTSGNSAGLEADVSLAPIDTRWLGPHGVEVSSLYQSVETWRASELLQWMETYGTDYFKNLTVMNSIHFGDLRLAMRRALVEGNRLRFVPRKKTGLVVFATENPSFRALSRLLLSANFTQLSVGSLRDQMINYKTKSSEWEKAQQYERLKVIFNKLFHPNLYTGHYPNIVVTTSDIPHIFQNVLLEYASQELSDMHCVFAFADWVPGQHNTEFYSMASHYSRQPGSHLRVIDVPLQAFGSYAALRWVWKRISGQPSTSSSLFQEKRFIEMAENNHVEFAATGLGPRGTGLLPVARLIFSLNVGRSGSRYLADVLKTTASPIWSVHEPSCPHGACSGGGAMRMQDNRLDQSYTQRKAIKIPMVMEGIASAYNITNFPDSNSLSVDCSVFDRNRWGKFESSTDLERFRPMFEVDGQRGCVIHMVKDVIYAETNPNFKSWIYDVVLDHFLSTGYQTTVIVVRKYIAAVLRSLYLTGYFSSRDGYNWMETATSVNSKLSIRELQDDSRLHSFDKLVSYVANSEAVFRYVKGTYLNKPSVSHDKQRLNFVDIKAEDLYSPEGTLSLIEQLGLKSTSNTSNLAGVVSDKYSDTTRMPAGQKLSLAKCEQLLMEFMQRLSPSSKAKLIDLFRDWDKMEGYRYRE